MLILKNNNKKVGLSPSEKEKRKKKKDCFYWRIECLVCLSYNIKFLLKPKTLMNKNYYKRKFYSFLMLYILLLHFTMVVNLR